ncbi:MAG: peptidoglycan-binding protein [Methanosphaera sp.]|nr:peptidoglycan-binding protein [Methanosphaera sp.]
MSKYTGSFPNIKTSYTRADVIADMNAWARKIASDNRYHYNLWNQSNAQSHKCPICSKLDYNKDSKHFGWNCIGFGAAVWHHGGALGNICNCHWISGPHGTGEYLLEAKTDADALKLAKKYTGIKDITIIRNKNNIPKSQWKAGDICLKFSGNTFEHVFYYPGGTTVIDSTRIYNDQSKWTKDVIANQIKERSYKSYTAKVIIRYNGNGTKYRNYIKMGDSGSEVKKLQQFLNWAMDSKLVVDGDFGAKTDTAVRAFQTKCKITVDGLFGTGSLTAAKAFDKVTPTSSATKAVKTKWKGIDISAWQDKISITNFKKAKASGIDYVILRLGYTGSSSKKPTIDSVFEHNYANAISAGLSVGVYYYSLATTTAKAQTEAEFVIKYLKGKKITYPVYIDMEDNTYQSKCSKSTLASVCNAFCKSIKNAGYIPGVYASLYWFNNKIGNITAEHTKWVAQYYKKCEYKGAYDMWQYSSSEAVSGIASKTDVSWCYKDFNAIQIDYVVQPDENNVVDVDYVVVNTKSIEELAKEVINGKWGTGDDRKKRLTKAGYDYDKVQAKVNEILKSQNNITKKTYSGTLPTLTLKKSNAEVINDAVAFGIWIAGDNSFHYGYTNKSKTINAHHNGCYFCNTNTDKGGRSKKGIVDYKKTYCCNPFVHACWAHGGCVPKALEICQKGSSWDFNKGHGYDKSSLFTNLGHPAKSKLKKGDVLCRDTHVALYIGNGKIVEAGSGDDNKKGSTKWNNSIRVRTLTDDNYKKFPRVHRFNSSVKTTVILRHGEVSDRVRQWQAFLNWYYDGQLGNLDRYFGDNTLKWTKKFQEEVMGKGQGDGLVGEKTLAAAKTVKK